MLNNLEKEATKPTLHEKNEIFSTPEKLLSSDTLPSKPGKN